MSVERNLPLIRERRQAIMKGDPARAAEQKKLGKLTARERIGLLLDQQSFVELDALAGRNGECGVVTGYGLIEGRSVYVYAQDYTQMGGAVGAEHARKVIKVMDLAAKTGCPVVSMMDSAGARLTEGVDAVNAYAQIAAKTGALSGVVPQICLVMGQCAGSQAVIAAMSDVVIAAGSARMYVNGPQVVSANTGKSVTAEALGGAGACAASGIAQLTAQSDAQAIALCRSVISMLPGNNLDDAPIDLNATDDVNRELTAYNAVERVDDVRALIAQLADAGSVIELSAAYAGEMITALCRIGGESVGVVATDAQKDEGALSVEGCAKAARFVALMDSFNIPVVSLVDSVGMAIGCPCAQGKLARAAALLTSALSEATVGRVCVVTGNAIGAGYMALASRPAADVVYAWPGSVIAPLAAPAAVQVLMEEKLKGVDDAAAKRDQLEKDYQDNVADGINAAKEGYVDDVIEPAQTRQLLAAALGMLAGKRDARLPKKHANLPL